MINGKQTQRRPPDWWIKQYGVCPEAAALLAAGWERCIYDCSDYNYGCLVGMIIMAWCARQVDTQQKAEMVQDASHLVWRAMEELD